MNIKTNPIAATPAEAYDRYLSFYAADALIQGNWHGRGGGGGAEGRDLACGLGALGPGVNGPGDCPAQVMPQWLARMVVFFFDGHALADPRCTWGQSSHRNKLKVVAYDQQAATVTGAAFQSGGHYGVTPWADPSNAVPGFDHEPANDADETAPALPNPDDRLVCVIRALDDTWHRPFTTLELAALQSLIDPDELDPTFTFDGAADSRWREGIGNAVPPDAAKAMADSFGQTLLMAWAGESFTLNSQPIWVRPFAVAVSIDMPHLPEDLARG